VGDEHSRTQTAGDSPEIARPWSSTWVSYYDQASRRRHRMGGYRKLRARARRKRRVELFTTAAIGMGVLALVSVFYVILNR
jgi:hypothetical protein